MPRGVPKAGARKARAQRSDAELQRSKARVEFTNKITNTSNLLKYHMENNPDNKAKIGKLQKELETLKNRRDEHVEDDLLKTS